MVTFDIKNGGPGKYLTLENLKWLMELWKRIEKRIQYFLSHYGLEHKKPGSEKHETMKKPETLAETRANRSRHEYKSGSPYPGIRSPTETKRLSWWTQNSTGSPHAPHTYWRQNFTGNRYGFHPLYAKGNPNTLLRASYGGRKKFCTRNVTRTNQNMYNDNMY